MEKLVTAVGEEHLINNKCRPAFFLFFFFYFFFLEGGGAGLYSVSKFSSVGAPIIADPLRKAYPVCLVLNLAGPGHLQYSASLDLRFATVFDQTRTQFAGIYLIP